MPVTSSGRLGSAILPHGGEPETASGNGSSLKPETMTLLSDMLKGSLPSYGTGFSGGVSTSASLGPLSAAAGGQASGNISAGPDGLDMSGNLGVEAGLGLSQTNSFSDGDFSLGNTVDAGLRAEAGADGTLSAGLTGIEASGEAQAGVLAGIGDTETANLDGIQEQAGMEAQSGVEAQANGSAELGADGIGLSGGAYAGDVNQVTANGTLQAGDISASGSASLMAPGSVGAGLGAHVGIHHGELDLGLNGGLDIGIGGLKFNLDLKLSANPIKDIESLGNVAEDVGKGIFNAGKGIVHDIKGLFSHHHTHGYIETASGQIKGTSGKDDALLSVLNDSINGGKSLKHDHSKHFKHVKQGTGLSQAQLTRLANDPAYGKKLMAQELHKLGAVGYGMKKGGAPSAADMKTANGEPVANGSVQQSATQNSELLQVAEAELINLEEQTMMQSSMKTE